MNDVQVGDVVIWHAQTSQRLPAIVRGINEDGTLRLSVLSDVPDEDIWSGEGATDTRLILSDAKGKELQRIGSTWDHLHQVVPRGDPRLDPKTGQSMAQHADTESWLPIDEVSINRGRDAEGKPVDDNDARLVELIERAKGRRSTAKAAPIGI
jgi:hypothetical protein